MTERIKIEKIAKELLKNGAVSVFLYGSRTTGDALEDSDWEIGAIFEDDKYIKRSELANLAPKSVSIYPFKLSDMKNGKPETPFTTSIWLNEIIRTAKTIAGQDIISTIPPPEITKDDLAKDSAFSKARALDAMLAKRHGHEVLAKDLFFKSCILGLRNLILRRGGQFPLTYKDIAKQSVTFLTQEYADLPRQALAVRSNEAELTLDLAFKNIGLFTEVVELEN